jgi:hypothetical protein
MPPSTRSPRATSHPMDGFGSIWRSRVRNWALISLRFHCHFHAPIGRARSLLQTSPAPFGPAGGRGNRRAIGSTAPCAVPWYSKIRLCSQRLARRSSTPSPMRRTTAIWGPLLRKTRNFAIRLWATTAGRTRCSSAPWRPMARPRAMSEFLRHCTAISSLIEAECATAAVRVTSSTSRPCCGSTSA